MQNQEILTWKNKNRVLKIVVCPSQRKRNGIYSMPSKKWEIESDDLCPPEFYERTLALESPDKIFRKTYCQKDQHKEKESKYYP